ncbi:hypothetical protein MTP99_007661 [Tenebrio molitor]|nr:hypothetical protein MTP99_007661 [Tenebrio molitor]
MDETEQSVAGNLEQPPVAIDEPCSSGTSRRRLFSPTATQTSNTLSSHTPRKLKLKQENKRLQNENAHLRKEVEQLRHANNVDNITLEQYKLLTHKFCPSMQLANFINVQVSQAAKLPKGRRYSTDFKNYCLRLNEVVLNTLKLKVDTFQQEDKLCMLCVDEMSIKANMFYNIGLDSVIGLEDVGSKKAFKPAMNATVLMRNSHGELAQRRNGWRRNVIDPKRQLLVEKPRSNE